MKFTGRTPKDKIFERFGRHVSSGKAEFFKSAGIDFVFGRREGIYVYDVDGKKLINCHSNGGVFNLGHRHADVIAALKEALDELDIGNHHLVSEHRSLLAERLAQVSPGDINRVVFAVGGGEAVDTAIKLARGFTKRPGIISAKGGYHGHTGFALSAGDEKYRAPFQPVTPEFTQVPFGDFHALEAAVNDTTAAVLFETIPATLGMPMPPEDYYANVRRVCDEQGALMIMDEVQTGLGRCGAVWGIDTYGVAPDIIITGKGLSGGIYPMSATLYADKLNSFFHNNPFIHISTFGGAEVGCYVALKVLDILSGPGFLEHVNAIASVFEKGFAQLKTRHSRLIVETRQRGLMIGIKMVNDTCGPLMTVAGFEHGILTIYANNDTSVSQILPPLIIKKDEAEEVIDRLAQMLTWVEQRAGIT